MDDTAITLPTLRSSRFGQSSAHGTRRETRGFQSIWPSSRITTNLCIMPSNIARPQRRPAQQNIPAVVHARDPKVIAKEKAAKRLAMPQPRALRGATQVEEPATAREIAEVLRFAGDPTRPHDNMMARIAAERLILHLESRGFVLMKAR